MASNKGGAGAMVAAFGALLVAAGVGAGVFVMQADRDPAAEATSEKADKKRDKKARKTEKRSDKKAKAKKAKKEKAKKEKAKKTAPKKTPAAETKLIFPPLDGAPIQGSDSAVVTVVAFGDFESLEYRKAAGALRDVTERYGSKVRVAFRQRPLDKHPGARGAALSSIAAHRQDKFWQYHEELLAGPESLRRDDLERAAKKIGLDVKVYRDALASSNTIVALEDDLKMAEKFDVSVVPTFFVNGERVAGETDTAALKAAIDRALERAKPRVDQGLTGDALYQKLAQADSTGGGPSQAPPSSPGH